MADYSYYSKLIVDHTKVGETDTGFAVLISGTYDGTDGEPDLRTTGNGGHIQNTASGGASGAYTIPADLVFRTSADLTQAGANLDFEIEKYDAATGEIVAWVQSGVDTVADTDIYMVFGNADVTTSQEDVAGTWDANFKGVWHLNETSGQHFDSTGNSNDSTSLSVVTQGTATGQVNGADEFGGSHYIYLPDLSITEDHTYTIEAWVKSDTTNAYRALFSEGNSADDSDLFLLRINDNNVVGMVIRDHADAIAALAGTTAFGTGQRYVVGLSNAANDHRVYLDATEEDTDATALGATTINLATIGLFRLGTGPSLAQYWDGVIDEFRVSDINRSTGYITTVFNNQSSPSTFYSVGAETERPRNPAVIFQCPAIV